MFELWEKHCSEQGEDSLYLKLYLSGVGTMVIKELEPGVKGEISTRYTSIHEETIVDTRIVCAINESGSWCPIEIERYPRMKVTCDTLKTATLEFTHDPQEGQKYLAGFADDLASHWLFTQGWVDYAHPSVYDEDVAGPWIEDEIPF